MQSDIERVRDHLANERTFLAWVRTAIGIIVFAFAIGRFNLALRQLAAVKGAQIHTTGFSIWLSTGSILFGVAVMIAAFFRYRQTHRQLQQNQFETTGGLIAFVAVATCVFGISLIVYLLLTQRPIWGS